MTAPAREDVLARLDAARKARERGAWSLVSTHGWPFGIVAADGEPVAHGMDRRDAEFAVANDPSFVVAACEALLSAWDDLAEMTREARLSREATEKAVARERSLMDVVEQARALVAEPDDRQLWELDGGVEWVDVVRAERLARVLDAAPAVEATHE